MASGRIAKRVDPMSKRIPENPKYKHIKSAIDTGASLSKYVEHLEEVKSNYRFRKDEIFKRLKVTTFVQLVVQVGLAAEQEDILDTPTPHPLDDTPPIPESPPNSARSSLIGVVHGIGELDVSGGSLPPSSPPTVPPAPPPPSSPYLLLDVRDKDDYLQCHIVTAMSYPVAMLSRSCNYFTRDILAYVNKPGRIIILYDDNERTAPRAATVFVQKGVDNVFILSGGLKVLCKNFPQGIISGHPPPSCLPTPPSSSRRSRRAPSPPPPVLPPQSHPILPSYGDIAVLQETLDDVLLASDPSSRASSRSTTSSRAFTSRTGVTSKAGPGRAGTSASMHSSFSTAAGSRGSTPWK